MARLMGTKTACLPLLGRRLVASVFAILVDVQRFAGLF
jgi:hypothetical protein